MKTIQNKAVIPVKITAKHIANTICYLICLIVLLFFGIYRSSAAVLVDIGNSSGVPAAPDGNGNYWNSILGTYTFGTTQSLRATDNATAGSSEWGLTITRTGTGSDSGFSSAVCLSTGAPTIFSVNGAYNDAYYDNYAGNYVTAFSFSGLNPSLTYSLNLWGSRTTSTTNTWQDGLISVTTGVASGGSSFTLQDGAAGNVLVVTFVPDVTGVFTFTFDKASNSGSGSAALNALEVSVVPEPSSLLLIATGMCLLFGIRRRVIGL